MKLPLIFAIVLGSAVLVCAQQQPPLPVIVTPAPSDSAPVRIATIFGQNALISTQEGKAASAKLSAKYNPLQDEFKHRQAELDSLRDQLRKGQATMSADAKAQLQQKIDVKSREVERAGEDSQAELEKDEGVMLEQLGEKLQAVIQEYASRNGYTVVIDVSAPNGPVVWASPSVDITNEIVRLYDQKHPVTATPPPAKTPPAAPPVKK